MGKTESVFKMLIKLNSKKPLIYVVIVLIILIIAWILNSYFHGTKKDREFFTCTINGVVDEVKKDFKGFYSVEINDTIYNLSIYGECIKEINQGDQIIKKSNSFIIGIKPRSDEGRLIEYGCYKTRKIK